MNDVKIFNNLKSYYLDFFSDVWDNIKILTKEGININNYSKEKPNGFIDKFKHYEYCTFKSKLSEEYSLYFDAIITDLDPWATRDRSDNYYNIKAIGRLLYWAEKILFYPNDDTNNMYSEYNEDSRLLVVHFIIDDITVSVSFQESAINLPNKNTNSLENYLDGSPDNTFATFVEINITRNFGNNITTEFKTILGSNEFGLKNDDYWLLDTVEAKMNETMIQVLYSIQDHILCNLIGVKNGITGEEFKNGIRVWKQLPNKK